MTNKTYEHLPRLLFNAPWMITERKMAQLQAFALAKLSGDATPWEGVKPPRAEVYYGAEVGPDQFRYFLDRQAMDDWYANGSGGDELAAAEAPAARSNKLVAIVPLYGVMLQRVGMLEEMSGAVSTERFKQQLREQVANPQVTTVVIDVDSPGGGVYGVDELAAELRELTKQKDIVAVSDSLMASAAYYAVSGASEIIASPSSETGSVGVLAVHYDYSRQAEQEGVTPTLIKAGKYKAEGHPDFPLTDEAEARIQEDVDRYYGMFVKAISAGRGVSVQAVRSGFGEGRVLGAEAAVAAGLADRVATLDETVRRFAGGGRVSNRRGKAAEEEQVELVAEAAPEDGAAERDRDMLMLDRDRMARAGGG